MDTTPALSAKDCWFHYGPGGYTLFDFTVSAISQTFLQLSHIASPDDLRILACEDKSKDSLVPLCVVMNNLDNSRAPQAGQ